MTYFQPSRRDTLLLDIDTERAYKQFKKQLPMLLLMNWVKITRKKVWRSRSGHRHIVLYLNRSLPAIERIALQVMLGSDPTRERLNWGRVKAHAPHPILFISRRRRKL